MRIDEIRLYRIRLPLATPYRLSYRTVEAFEPLLLEVVDGDGRSGWGEGQISPGSGAETPAGGCAFCRQRAARLPGGTSADAKAGIRWRAPTRTPAGAPGSSAAARTPISSARRWPKARRSWTNHGRTPPSPGSPWCPAGASPTP